MSKDHIVKVNITNNTGKSLTFKHEWFDSGRLADNSHWPKSIKNGDTISAKCYEKDWAITGCSGWVQYTIGEYSLYFAFSNPLTGSNKVGIGITNEIWDNMDSHYDCSFKLPLKIGSDYLICDIQSSSGDTNIANFNLETFSPTLYLSNPIMNNIEKTFKNISSDGSRRYYESDLPTSVIDSVESHFKGVAKYKDKMIYSHSNIGGDYGKYLTAYQVVCSNQGNVDKIYKTEPKGLCHPGGEQVCGSFMVVGIQKEAMHMKNSKIQIYDIRYTEVNDGMKLIGEIDRSGKTEKEGAINGCAMTKEIGDNGKYIIACIQNNRLTVYKSKYSRLVPDDSKLPFGTEFEELTRDNPIDLDKEGFPGIVLATQKNGDIYFFGLDGDPEEGTNDLFLYKLNLQNIKSNSSGPQYEFIGSKNMNIPGMSDSVINFKKTMQLARVGGLLPPLLIGLVLQEFQLLNYYYQNMKIS